MNAKESIINSKEAFRKKAAWFSLLIPPGSTLIGYYFLEKFSDSMSTFGAGFCVVGFLLIQIISLAAGIFGIFAKTNSTKIISLIGILMTCAMVVYAFVGLILISSGICG